MTPVGDLHLTAGTFAIAWQFAAAGALVPGLKAWRPPRPIVRLGIVLLGISLLAAGAIQVAIWRPDLGIPEGLAMRGVVVPLLLWWALIALAVRRRAPRKHSARDAA